MNDAQVIYRTSLEKRKLIKKCAYKSEKNVSDFLRYCVDVELKKICKKHKIDYIED